MKSIFKDGRTFSGMRLIVFFFQAKKEFQKQKTCMLKNKTKNLGERLNSKTIFTA